MPTVIREAMVSCSSGVVELWSALTDTERMNRALGLAPVSFAPLQSDSAARFVGRTWLGGFPVEYEERPYEWEHLRCFGVRRRMRRGPARSLHALTRFEPRPDGGTDVHFRLTIDVKSALIAPFAGFQARGTLKRMAQEALRIDRALRDGATQPTVRGPINEALLERASRQLRAEAVPALVEPVLRHLREASDQELTRIRPYVLADRWGADRFELLEVLLLAVRCGLLELRWELVCPSCQLPSETLPSLSALQEHGSCQLCEIEFGLEVDEAIEATFAPAPALRPIAAGPYCIGGPARVPHVLSQVIVPAGGDAILPAPTEPGRYRVFLRGGTSHRVEVIAEGPAALELPALLSDEGQVWSAAPGAAIRVPNPTGEERHAKLERPAASTQAATAREFTTVPCFRRLFTSELLRPGTSLRVSRVAILFSDLTDSTQLYSDVGDGPAFKLVHDHFDVVFGEVARHQGSVVKTIGDAVMAVFRTEADALAAGMSILSSFETFRQEHPDHRRTRIKLGVHAGPCYVVTANNVLDYFGQTVNVAARLQALAQGGELVAPVELVELALNNGWLAPNQELERFPATLKGIAVSMEVARLSAVTGVARARLAPEELLALGSTG